MMPFTLQTEMISKSFGGVKAINEINFSVNMDELVGLIGPNGAGKSTLFGLMTGFISPTSGSLLFDGKIINNYKPYQLANLGIVRTFQLCKPFAEMKVIDNVITGSFLRSKNYKEATEIADDTLNFLGLYDKRDYLASDLSIPDLKRLEIAKVLATRPKILLLDEVMAGLNLREQHSVADMIEIIHAKGVGIVLVEHSIAMITRLCRRIMVLDRGINIAEGDPIKTLTLANVRTAYLGDVDNDSFSKS